MESDICNLTVISNEATVQVAKCVNSGLTCLIESKHLFWRHISSKLGGWEEDVWFQGEMKGQSAAFIGRTSFVESRPVAGLVAGTACPSAGAHQIR